MKRVVLLSVLALLVLMAASLPAQAATLIETYTNPTLFKARLAGAAFPVKTVTFDGIKAGNITATSFAATKFKLANGMVITGEGGQFVSRAFGLPADFRPVSKYNMYAPGPINRTGPDGSGGNETDVTFGSGGGSTLAAGFGCYFIDADYPGIGPASFTVFDASASALGGTGVVVTANGANAFRGLVAVDSVTNKPIPVFARVHIVNGDGWLGNDNNEGVALDNFMAGTATYGVSGKVLHRSGSPFRGVKVSLKGTFTLKTTTSASGRFTIPNVPAGTYVVTPTKKGVTFKPAKVTAHVVAGTLKIAAFRER